MNQCSSWFNFADSFNFLHHSNLEIVSHQQHSILIWTVQDIARLVSSHHRPTPVLPPTGFSGYHFLVPAPTTTTTTTLPSAFNEHSISAQRVEWALDRKNATHLSPLPPAFIDQSVRMNCDEPWAGLITNVQKPTGSLILARHVASPSDAGVVVDQNVRGRKKRGKTLPTTSRWLDIELERY